MATASQVAELRRQLLDTGPCTFFEWPAFLGQHPPTVEKQYPEPDSAKWREHVSDMWARSPKNMYKWIRYRRCLGSCHPT
eukprot:4145054-Amphidinium_carterae.2